MNIGEVKKVILEIAKHKAPITPMLWGQPGVAKTAIMKEIADELGYAYFPLRLSQREAVDLLGLMYLHVDEETKQSVTDYHPPKWFARALHKGKAIIFLDELNRARPEVLKASFELVERQLNGIKLPDNVIVIAACNPDDERNDVISFDDATIDRFMHLRVNPSSKVWLDWARQSETGEDGGPTNIDQDIINFISTTNGALFTVEKNDSGIPVTIKQTPRSWHRASILHRLKLPMELEMECLNGIVGTDLTMAFRKSIDDLDNKPFTAEEICGMSEKTQKRLKKYSSVKDTNRLDLIKESIKNLSDYVKNNSLESLKHAENIKMFLKILPEDLTIVAIGSIVDYPKWAGLFRKDVELNNKMLGINKVLTEAEKADRASPNKTKPTRFNNK
jgi:hypothetical protein